MRFDRCGTYAKIGLGLGRSLEEIIEEDPFLDVLPEDVYTACKTENAHLWITDAGFVVTTFFGGDPYTNKRTLLIWFAWAKLGGTSVLLAAFEF